MSHHNKKKIRFITNPFSGTKSKANIEGLIQKYLDMNIFDYEISYTQYAGHATELAKEASLSNFYAVIAVGGDGTINEIGTAIRGTSTALGIIPYGSGNGFSYHIGIKRDVIKAIQTINQCHATFIDTGAANGRFFINVAGLGLDATVAYKTKLNTKRGFIPYFINTLKESLGFTYLNLSIKTHDNLREGEYAMAVIANGSVYGYDFTIAPDASITDGKFDIILVKKTHVFRYFLLVPRMLNKTVHKSPLVDFFKTDRLEIINKAGGYFHLDGEGFISEGKINFELHPASLLLLN